MINETDLLANFNPENNKQIILKVKLPRENPELESGWLRAYRTSSSI